MSHNNSLEHRQFDYIRFHDPELMGSAPFLRHSFFHGGQKVHVTLKRPLTKEQWATVEAHKAAHKANDAAQIQATDAQLPRKLQRHTPKWLVPNPWF